MNIKNNYRHFIFSLTVLAAISSNVLAETDVRDHRVLKRVEPRAVVRDHRVLKNVKPRAVVRDHRTGNGSNTVVKARLPARTAGVRKIARPTPKSDVTIQAILSDSCRCDLRDVGAVSGKGLKVIIKNIGRATAKNIVVTVSHFQLIARTRKLVTKNRILDLRPNETRTIYVTPAAYLTSTGTEFIATVTASNDGDLSNNRFTSFGCATHYVE